MDKKTISSTPKETIRKLKSLAKEKESIRSKLEVTARKLAKTAKEKEYVRRKLVTVAEEKEDTRSKLAVTAKKLSLKAKQLAVIAKEKENIRRKLVVTAKEKEGIRVRLEVAAKDLAHAKAIDEAMLESIGDGLLATDEKGNITLINKTAEKLLGKKGEEVIGKVFSKVIFLEDEKGVSIPAEKHPISLTLLAGTTADTAGITFYNVRKDTTKFPLAIMATPVILESKVIGAIKVFRDITKEKEIDKAKSEFVSLTSHQLKTPATIVSLYAEQLLNEYGGKLTEKQKEYISEIRSANGRMVDIVNTLLNISRIEMGIFSMDLVSVDIIAFFKNVIKELQTDLNEKHIVVKEVYHKPTHVLLIDTLLLNMVFSNLISNSIRYNSTGGTISVKSQEVQKNEQFSNKIIKENSLLVSVSDNGCGIPVDQQDKIFTKFFRSDNARNHHTDGTGLGLYIVKSILDHIGGDVWFLSKENIGTTFYFTIPLHRVKQEKT